MDPSAESAEVASLLSSVFSTYGYDLRRYAPASMGRRIRRAIARLGASGARELEERVVADPKVFATFLDLITVHVSEMFRDPEFFVAFRRQVIPTLRTHPLPKVWHAGCAGGEEVYAAAILLGEEGLYERTQIYATDISGGAVQHAKEGVYPNLHEQKFTENHARAGGVGSLSKYYQKTDAGLVIDDSMKRNILFFQHDLIADHVFGEMHVIFCRNVLIYFENESRQAILAKLCESLCPGGFLCVGGSERIRDRPGAGLALQELSAHGIYRWMPRGDRSWK